MFAGSTSPSDLAVDGDDLWWVEERPAEAGRQALVRWREGEGTVDVGPRTFSTRTRVHEYGGGAFAVRDGVVVAASGDDQRWWRLDVDPPVPVTPEPAVPSGLRVADARFLPGRAALVAVVERHGVALDGSLAEHDGQRNEVALIDLEAGTVRPLVTGRSFVASPRPSPDGSRLAWLAWDHPDMPWDAAELWLADLDGDAVSGSRQVGGGPGRSAVSPCWLGPDRLLHAEELDGWWRPVLSLLDRPGPGGSVVPVSRQEWSELTDALDHVEVGGPLWRLGDAHLAGLPDDRQAWVLTSRARSRLALVTPGPGGPELVDLGVPSVRVRHLRSWRDGVAWLGIEQDGTTTVSTWTPDDGVRDVRRNPIAGLRPGDRGEVRHVTYPTADGAAAHAWLHLPAAEGVTGPDGERPPLLVFIHGGPTGAAVGATTRAHAFWTTRGFAVADVNHRGSTGYGQAFRSALDGRWGEADVQDVIAVARGLAADGLVDGDRMAIRGGSAGGFTTLAALTTPNQPFACGTSFFGVTDLRALAEHTHAFESRYLDRLVGPLPDADAVYAERSPLTRASQLDVPVLVLQGSLDAVVPPAQAEAIVAAAAENGVPHAYLLFEGERHGFRRLENLVAWHEAELSFYGQVMGFEPADDLTPVELVGR